MSSAPCVRNQINHLASQHTVKKQAISHTYLTAVSDPAQSPSTERMVSRMLR